MNNLVKNSSLLSIVLFGAIALSGCNGTISREQAKQIYQTYSPRYNAGMVEKYILERTVTERDGETYYELINADQTYQDFYVYYLSETTNESGEKTTSEVLAYDKKNGTGYSSTKDAEGVKESEITSHELSSIVSQYLNEVFDFACADYTYLFEELDGTEATYYSGLLNTFSVTLTSNIEGVSREAEYHFTAQSSLEKGTETVTYADGTTYSSITTVTFNAAYTRKASL